jgi:outer membrane lipoprotein-sorting protein
MMMTGSQEADKLTLMMSGIACRFSRMRSMRMGAAQAIAVACVLASLTVASFHAQQPDSSAVIRSIDAAVHARFDAIAEYTVTEHYAVYRGSGATKPMAEMTVKTLYRRDEGKNYTILSQSGPEIVQKMAFRTLLDNEQRINQPGNREASWFTSANYEMNLKPGGPMQLDGRECLLLAISPKRKAPNLIVGTIWVDAKDGSIVQIQGMASKSPSFWAGPTQMTRQYINVNGFAMATHARAVANSFLFGQTVVTIDYSDYHIQLRPAW